MGEAGDPLQLHVASGRLVATSATASASPARSSARPPSTPIAAREISPGSQVQSDDELDDFIREHAESAYHPCGTCQMGRASDPLSVVDPECRVIGVEGLRVADSSIFPRVTNGNLNAPVDHDRREGRRPHSRPHAAAAVQPGTLDQSALARKRPLTEDMLQKAMTTRRNLSMKAQPKASHYINGSFVDDERGATVPVIYPATGETIAMLHSATEKSSSSPSRPRARRSPPGRG